MAFALREPQGDRYSLTHTKVGRTSTQHFRMRQDEDFSKGAPEIGSSNLQVVSRLALASAQPRERLITPGRMPSAR